MITPKISKLIKYIQEKQEDLDATHAKSHVGGKPKINTQKLRQHNILSTKYKKLLMLKVNNIFEF